MKLALAVRFFCRKVNSFTSRFPLSKDSSSDVDKNHSKQFQELLGRTSYQLILHSKVTQYQTADYLQYYLPRLAEQVNMPLVNITLEEVQQLTHIL